MVVLSTYLEETFQVNFAPKLTDNNKEVACNNGGCGVRVTLAATPIIHDISPHVVYKDQVVYPVIEPRSSQDFDSSHTPYYGASIDGFELNWKSYQGTGTTYCRTCKNFIPSKVMDQPANDKSSLQIEFSSGYAVYHQHALHCPPDAQLSEAGDNCYFVKTAGRIDTVHTHEGSAMGKQFVRIKGYFAKTTVGTEVTIDGAVCTILKVTSRKIECETTSNSPSVEADYAHEGNWGWTAKRHDNSQYISMDNIDNVPVSHTYTLTQLEIPTNNDNYYGITSEGWFVAPADGAYTFYVACDNHCIVDFSMDEPVNGAANGRAGTDVNFVEIINIGWTPQRNYWYKADGSQQSVSIQLTEGDRYMMRFRFKEDGGSDWMSVAVEIAPSNPSFIYENHRQLQKEIQAFDLVRDDMTFESWTFSVTSEVCAGYWLFFVNSEGESFASDNEISGTASANEFLHAIDTYYNSQVGSPVHVSKEDIYDTNTLTNITTFVARKYTVTLVKQINGASFQNLMVLSMDTQCTTAFELPEAVQLSTAPIQGNFQLAFTPDGASEPLFTDALNINSDCNAIVNKLEAAYLPW